ncbi:hypothetical protein EAI89_13575 [Eubacterium sp. am_0171]|nr:hypothetical protein EAI89_13575 [Eubacterium sp. am_0171]
MRGLTALNCGLGGPEARNNHYNCVNENFYMKTYFRAIKEGTLMADKIVPIIIVMVPIIFFICRFS